MFKKALIAGFLVFSVFLTGCGKTDEIKDTVEVQENGVSKSISADNQTDNQKENAVRKNQPRSTTEVSRIENQEDDLNIHDEVSSWQTYRNEKYGFEIKYPPKYLITDYTDKNIDRSPTVTEHNNPIVNFTESGKGDLTAYIEWWEEENDHLDFQGSEPDFQVKIKDKYIVVDYTPGIDYVISSETKEEWEKIISTFKVID